MAVRGLITTPEIQALLLGGVTGIAVGVNVAINKVFNNIIGLKIEVDKLEDVIMVIVIIELISWKIPQVRQGLLYI